MKDDEERLKRVYSLAKVLDTFYNIRQQVRVHELASEESNNGLEAAYYSQIEEVISGYINELKEEVSSIVRVDKTEELKKILGEIKKDEEKVSTPYIR